MAARDLFKDTLETGEIDMDQPMGGYFPVTETPSINDLAKSIIAEEKLSLLLDRSELRKSGLVSSISQEHKVDFNLTRQAIALVDRVVGVATDIQKRTGRDFMVAAVTSPRSPLTGRTRTGKTVVRTPYFMIMQNYSLQSHEVNMVLTLLRRILNSQ